MKAPKLPPFDAAEHCPKCGHDDIVTVYKRDAHCSHHPDYCVMHPVTQPDCCDSKKSEHFHRFCQRCHYRWAEAILPAVEA